MTEQTTPAAAGRHEGLTAVLDALEQAVQAARAVPMSASVLVSRAELLDLVDQARSALPTQIGRADEVLAAGQRIVMLTGPSAAGKTTSAHKIADAIAARGRHSQVVSLDDFYIGEVVSVLEKTAE